MPRISDLHKDLGNKNVWYYILTKMINEINGGSRNKKLVLYCIQITPLASEGCRRIMKRHSY